MDLFKRETPTEFSPDQLELLEVVEEVGPEVDQAVEEEIISELREAWEGQNQVNPFKPKDERD